MFVKKNKQLTFDRLEDRKVMSGDAYVGELFWEAGAAFDDFFGDIAEWITEPTGPELVHLDPPKTHYQVVEPPPYARLPDGKIIWLERYMYIPPVHTPVEVNILGEPVNKDPLEGLLPPPVVRNN